MQAMSETDIKNKLYRTGIHLKCLFSVVAIITALAFF